MATGRKTVVVGQVIDPTLWGNPLWDQSVQTFASAADRTTQFPAPKLGAVTWLDDVKRLYVCTNATGPVWTAVATGPVFANGKFSGTTSAGGVVLIPHGLGGTPPAAVVCMGQGNTGGTQQVAQPAVTNQDGTNIAVTVLRSDTGAVLASTAVVINWFAAL